MRDLDDFNRLEERALELTRQLEEGTWKSEQIPNGIDEQSERKAYEMTEEYYANQKRLNDAQKE
jgi:hypothetical protein